MLWLSVMDWCRAADGVDHQRDFAVFNRVHDVWAAFLHFVDRLHDDAVFFQVFGGTACGADTIAECLEVLCGFDDERFVFVAYGEEHFCLLCSSVRQRQVGL